MVQLIEPQTSRLRLRQWQAADYAPFAALNADPDVMAYFPSLRSRAESDRLIADCAAHISQFGWGFWAAELKATGTFIGFVGLNEAPAALPFSPCVEIGWRLAKDYWGQGLATEAAQAALGVGFEQLKLDEIVAFTPLANRRSVAVMERLHMQRDAESFEHPAVPAGSSLTRHHLYRLSHTRWSAAHGT